MVGASDKGNGEMAALPVRGRGTGLNPGNRFESFRLEVLPEAACEARREHSNGVQLPTKVYRETTRTVINRVDSPDLGFRWTLNPYRGCEHGCVYCMAGDTRILMADGGVRQLANLQVGDEIHGTVRRGLWRRFVKTEVLACWEVNKPAYRVTLENGITLVASADHRFLTDRGWKFVLGTQQGARRRPHLTVNNTLLGIGALGSSPPTKGGEYMKGYLCGIIRGDGALGFYEYERPGRSHGNQYLFRLAMVDEEALARARTYLCDFGVPTFSLIFKQASHRRKEVKAIRTNARERVKRIQQLIAWPSIPSPEWSKGFLAGIFDAEGSYSGGIMRIHNTDAAIIEETARSLRRFGFFFAREHTNGTNRPVAVLRITGGLPDHLRFFQTTDPAIPRKRCIGGTALKTRANLRVESIEPLGAATQLFDITTGTGDFIANGVVSHNCYARPTHEALGFSSGLDFETKIVAKPDAPRLLRQELAAPAWKGEPIVMSGVTDAYQPLERRLQITRQCLEVMAACRQPVSLITKNRLILRDLDLLQELNRHRAVNVALSVTTLDPRLTAVMEPRTSSPRERLRVIRELSGAGIPVTALLAPIIPGLNDREIPRILEAAAEAGARAAGWIMLRLPHQVKTIFLDWLKTHFPDRAPRIEGLIRQLYGGRLYDPSFGVRQRGRGPFADHIAGMFHVFARRYGLRETLPPPSGAAFRKPQDSGQLRLFEPEPPEVRSLAG